VTVRSALRLVDIVIGTSEETKAAALKDESAVSVEHSQVSDAHVAGDIGRRLQPSWLPDLKLW
jgi:5-dehydro-2-deoxygluconokinase